ncbi:MAG: archaeosortase/exosortase family protein [Balneolaceae bacterium]|jgi:exosortase/archaeosortase family protein
MQWLKSGNGILLLKVLGIYLGWYLAYELWLLPNGSLDYWLTTNIVSVSAGILQAFGYKIYAIGRLVGLDQSAGVYLADGCIGISAIGLFAGFALVFPGRWVPRIAFIVTGIGMLYLVNIVRIVTLAIVQVDWPGMFRIACNYSAAPVFYITVFVMCIVWVKWGRGSKPA